MGRPDECAGLIKQGKTPSDIAREIGVTYSTVIDYLFRAVGHSRIGLVDIVISWPQARRKRIEKIIAERATDYWFTIYQEMRNIGDDITREDIQLYLQLRNVYIGDLYFMICELELHLHSFIKTILQKEFNQTAEDWWKLGVPENVRKKCLDTMDRSRSATEKGHPYSYATFIQLAKIIEEHWDRFVKYLPIELIKGEMSLPSYLYQTNRIRNKVMHPLNSGLVQEDEDFRIVRELHTKLIRTEWTRRF